MATSPQNSSQGGSNKKRSVSTARVPQPDVSSFAATARDGGCRLAEGHAPAQREAVFSSLTLVAAAFARGACALCHHVCCACVRLVPSCARGIACKPCCCHQSDHRSPTPRALCRRDDSRWSIPRRAPSGVARLFIVRINRLQNLTSHSYTVSGAVVLAVS